jgi:hypothetical protein
LAAARAKDAATGGALLSFVTLYQQLGPRAAIGPESRVTMRAEAARLIGELACAPTLRTILTSGTGL